MAKKSLVVALSCLAAAIVILVAVALVLLHNFSGKKAEEAVSEETVAVPAERILGNYDVKFEYADSVVRLVGVIDKDINDNYVLTILSDYAPRVLVLDVASDGTIDCDELGEGTMTYKESVDKTTISFSKEDYRCVLTK